jgi:hypothetical protein
MSENPEQPPELPQYRNVGTSKVAGHQPGVTFHHDFPEAVERFLLRAGHLIKIKPQRRHDASPEGGK